MPDIIIHADGACSPNPGNGGWATTIELPKLGKETVLHGGEKNSTNNVMELTAALRGLQAAVLFVEQYKYSSVLVRLDSEYALNGISKWLKGWIAKGWKTAAGKPVANREIWKDINDTLSLFPKSVRVEFEHVKGHAGDPKNERVDQLAVIARKRVEETGQAFEDTYGSTPSLPVTTSPSNTQSAPMQLSIGVKGWVYQTKDFEHPPEASHLNDFNAEGFEVLQVLRVPGRGFRVYLRQQV